jgi:hypothetical protein
MQNFEWSLLKTCADDPDEEEHFNCVKNIPTTFVLMTLLLRSNEAGLLYSARTNYRLATAEKLNEKNNLQRSMLECVYNSNKTEKVFNNSNISITFYSLVKRKSRYIDSPRVGSIAKEDVQYGTQSTRNPTNNSQKVIQAEVHIPQAAATFVTEKEYLKLAYILNLKPKRLKKSTRTGGSLFDFKTLLTGHGNQPLNDMETIKDFINSKLNWPFFEINPVHSPAITLWRLRSFMQVLTGVGIAVLEGSHRMTLAAKLLTGQNVSKNLPMNVMKTRLRNPVPGNSTLYHVIQVDVVMPKEAGENSNAEPNYWTRKSIEACRKWSEEIAYKKTFYIQATWRDWIEGALEALHNLNGVHVLTEWELISKEVNWNGKYLDNLKHVVTCVADALVAKMPAKLKAQNGRRIITTEDEKSGKKTEMDPEEFKTAILSGKLMGLTNNFFWRVSQ